MFFGAKFELFLDHIWPNLLDIKSKQWNNKHYLQIGTTEIYIFLIQSEIRSTSADCWLAFNLIFIVLQNIHYNNKI